MEASTEELTAIVDLRMDADVERAYRLPGSGSPSALYVLDGQQIAAVASTADGRELAPGSEDDRAVLTFWADEARILVTEGSPSSIWSGGIIGGGVVRSVRCKRDR